MEPTETQAEQIKEKTGQSAVEIIQDFTDKLTIRRVMIALIAGITALALYTSYEYRSQIFNKIVSGALKADDAREWDIRFSRGDLDTLVKNSDLVKFAMVAQVDLRNNRRATRYWNLEDPLVAKLKQRAEQLLPQAVFDYDEKNTQQIVAVLNNEFVCSKFEDTFYVRHFPELEESMPYICRMAIPPFYGRFVGILTFGLKSEPTPADIAALKLEASRISIQIYINDVIKNR